LWLNRTLVHHDPPANVVVAVPEGHPLADLLEGLTRSLCVPALRSRPVVRAGDTHEMCGARCILGDTTVLAPPPGRGAETWAADREDRQRACARCDMSPSLGVIGMVRRGAAPLSASDATQLEAIALSVAPIVETALLTQQLRQTERYRKHVLDSMASALIAVNMRGEIQTFNRAAEDLLGFRQSEVLGQQFGARFGAAREQML